MLPGFRFLFAAIVLSMSILVFGLGAAALLRAAHEEFASTPPWHATPETIFAQQSETARPVLAMLRVEPPATEPKAADNVPTATAPAEPAAIAATPAEPEPERIAALKPEDASPAEAAKPEVPLPGAPAQNEAVAAQADGPASAAETKLAAVMSSANEAALAAPEQTGVPNSPDADIAATKIATLGGPPVTIEMAPPAKAAAATSDKKHKHARRTSQRRRIALPARVAGQAPQPPANPFAQPTTR
jgi:hypothetical protein